MNLKVNVLLIFLLAFPSATRAQVSLKQLSLEESIQTGLANATAALKGQNAIDITGAQILGSYGQFLPDLSVGAGYAFTSGNTLTSVTSPILVSSQRSNVNYQILSTLNIFNGYSDYSVFKATKLNKEIAELSLERARQLIVLDISQSYLQLVLDKQIAGFADQNYKTSIQREEQLTELVKVGRRAQSDLYQQQAQTSTDLQFLNNALNKLHNDKILLLLKLRINSTSDDYEFSDPIMDDGSANFNDEQELIRKALGQRADLKSSRYNEEVANWYIKRYRGGYLPKVFFSAAAYGVGAHYNSLTVNGTQPSKELRPFGTQLWNQVYGVVALNASWNIFDKYYTKSNVAIAKITALNARIDYDNVNLQIISEVRQAYGNYKTALQQIETAEKGLVAAQRAYETVNGRYTVGAANFIELAITQNNLLLAQQNKAQVNINLFLQKKTLDYYLGN
jgi:outer membrane protein